jgi:hypothetical protein
MNGNIPSRPYATVRRQNSISEVIKIFKQLDEASAETLLDRLATAVAEERVQDARELVKQLRQTYAENTQTEATTVAKAQAVQKARTETASQLSRHIQTASKIEFQRANMLGQVVAYIESQGTAVTSSTARQAVEELRQQEAQLTTTQQAVESAITERSIPPEISISLVSAVSPQTQTNNSVDVEITVTNIGDEPAREVVLNISTPGESEPEESSISLGTIGAGQTLTPTVSLTGSQPGVNSLTVTIESTNGGYTSESATVSTVATTDSTSQSPIEIYDTNDNGDIELGELIDAGFDFIDGNITIDQLIEVGTEFTV